MRYHRIVGAVLGAVLAAVVVGCMSGQDVAEYPGGVRFQGRGSAFNRLAWRAVPGGAAGCPLIMHFPGVRVGEAELADPKALAARGWTAKDFGDGMSQMACRYGCVSVWADYRNGRLERIGVNANGCPDVQVELFELAGKRLPLPVTQAELTAALGPPSGRGP